jgi:DNA-binding response OmpR family regulator
VRQFGESYLYLASVYRDQSNPFLIGANDSMSLYRSILLIDDDTEDQEIFLEAIQEVDPRIQCSCANDAEAALRQLNEEILIRPDILFIDLNMPKINGKQLLKEIKKSDQLKGIPVIMYSTFFGPQDIDEITSLGAVHYLIKATRFIELCNALKFILSKNWN